MFRLTRAQLAARPWPAVALFLLGLLAVGAAVAAPAYTGQAQRSVATSDIAAAPARGLTVSVSQQIVRRAYPDHPGKAPDTDPGELARAAPEQLRLTGYAGVYETALHVAGGRSPADYVDTETGLLLNNTVVVARPQACAHVRIVSGRCVGAPREAVVDEATAAKLSVAAGSTLEIHYGYPVLLNGRAFLQAEGEPQLLSIVGVYRIPDVATDAYWASSSFALSTVAHAIVDPTTLAVIAPFREDHSYAVYPQPGALAADQLDTIRTELTAALARARADGREPSTQLTTLLRQIEVDQRRAALGPIVAGVPLVLLCWFIIFLAVTQTAAAQRSELALLRLRGVSTGDRWWLALAGSFPPLIAGGVIGFAIGHTATGWFGRASLAHPTPTVPNGESWLAAAIGLGGALLAGVFALRADLAEPALDLLRRVARLRRWQSPVLIAIIATLAGLAVVEAHDQPSLDPSGLVLLGPALVIFAAGLLLASLLDPVAGRIGTAALRRGHLALGLAAVELARPRTSRRVVALLIVAVGLFAFASSTDGVARATRTNQARISLGADRVLTVATTDPAQLLNAVRSVDPAGAFAMAAEVLPADSTGVALLAVDADRLPTVAAWPDETDDAAGDRSAQGAVRLVRPALPPPIVVRERALLVDAAYTAGSGPLPTGGVPANIVDTLRAQFLPLDLGSPIVSTEARLLPGAHTYRLEMPCLPGCRLAALNPHLFAYAETRVPPVLTVTAIRSADGATLLAGPDQLGHWLDASRSNLQVTAVAEGLRLQGVAAAPNADRALVHPPDQTDVQPVVASGDAIVRSLMSVSGGFFTDRVGSASVLPRLGGSGGLADLDLALRNGVLLTGATPQVWLNEAAPADILARLAAAGVQVVADQTIAIQVAAAAQQPRALGWRFVAALSLLAILLGAAGLAVSAAVERPARLQLANALRRQGLRARTVNAATLIGFLGLVAFGLFFGFAAALLAWWLQGAYLPIVEGRPFGQGLPGWPDAATRIGWLAAAVALIAVATALTVTLAPSRRLATNRSLTRSRGLTESRLSQSRSHTRGGRRGPGR